MAKIQVGSPTHLSTPIYYVSKPLEVTLPDKPILLTINLVLQTAYLKSSVKPISLLLLGRTGIGKSRLLSPLAKVDYIKFANDITPKFLVEFLEKVKRGEKKFLVIPDFIHCMSHSKATKTVLISILRSMLEEGVIDLSDYQLEFKSDKPVRAGLITAITESGYGNYAEAWKTTGFLSRLLPFSFNHSRNTQTQIMDNIDSRKPDHIEKVRFKVNRNPKTVKCPPRLFNQLRVYEETLAQASGSLPYRHQIQLNALAEAHAVLNGRVQVTQVDINTIVELTHWLNYSFHEV